MALARTHEAGRAATTTCVSATRTTHTTLETERATSPRRDARGVVRGPSIAVSDGITPGAIACAGGLVAISHSPPPRPEVQGSPHVVAREPCSSDNTNKDTSAPPQT